MSRVQIFNFKKKSKLFDNCGGHKVNQICGCLHKNVDSHVCLILIATAAQFCNRSKKRRRSLLVVIF